MTSIDIASLGAAPSPDATSASAETPAGATDRFAAFLDDAAGTPGAPADASSEDEDEFDELAALAMPSLLSLGATATVPLSLDADGVEATEATATEITDQTVVTDLTDRAVIVDLGMSSHLTTTPSATMGNDLGVNTDNTPIVTETPAAAPKTLPDSESIDAVTPNASTKAGDSAAPTGQKETLEVEVTPAARTSRSSMPSRTQRANDTRNADSPTTEAAATSSSPSVAQTIEATRASVPTPPAADVRASGSAAARFARALERAATPATSESTSSAASATANNTSSSNTGQQSESGDVTPDHAARLSAAIRQSVPNVMAFTVNGPAPIDTRAMAAAVAHAAGHADAPVAIPERDVVAQLVQSMRVQLRDGIGEAVVKLKPEHLGSVQISIRIENGAIKATVQAEAPAVRQWLESQQDTLRTSLADQGLRLERFVVEPDERRPAHDDTAREDAREQKERRRRQQRRMLATDEPIFEVTV